MSVRKEKIEFKQTQMLSSMDEPNEEEMYQLNEEIEHLDFEMRAVQENIETLEEKNDFIESKMSSIQVELTSFSPSDIEALRFDSIHSIEGARACLGAFFGILLDVNVYKKQLENQARASEALIDGLQLELEELRKIQQANEHHFQKQIE